MQSELKPCPFCSAELTVPTTVQYPKLGLARLHPGSLDDGSCPIAGWGFYDEQLAAWNARASDAEITRLTEALRAAEEREKALREAVDRLRSGYDDAISGYRYILTRHGRLEGVGFTRVMDHYHEWVVMPQREGLMAGSHTLAGAKP